MESSASRNIPYILNGELYEIQCQSGENVTVRCCNCPDRVYRGSVRSTGNFHMHIKRRHPELLPRLLEMKVNALLDRRDKHIKYRRRKSNQRTTAQANIKQEQKMNTMTTTTLAPPTTVSIEQRSTTIVKCVQEVTSSTATSTSSEPPPLALMATHKLKIKTAFQRHKQLQQEAQAQAYAAAAAAAAATAAEATALRQQNNALDEPIDYSVKETVQPISVMDVDNNNNNNSSSISHTTTTAKVMPNHASQQQPSTPAPSDHIEQQQPPLPLPPPPPPPPHSPPPLQLANCPECHNANDMNDVECVLRRTFPMAIVKHENIIEQAMDLSYQSTLAMPTTYSSPSNTSTMTTTAQLCVDESRALQRRRCMRSASSYNEKWNELWLQVETSLRDIQREMSTRNQIEIAKFKYLHPGFNFHC